MVVLLNVQMSMALYYGDFEDIRLYSKPSLALPQSHGSCDLILTIEMSLLLVALHEAK